MRSTTTQSASDVTIAALAEGPREQLLQPRRVHLKQRAPRDRRVHQLERDIACGKAKPVEMTLRVKFAQIDDGAPIEAVLASYFSEIAILREYHQQRTGGHMPAIPRSLLGMMERETRAQSVLDAAQLRLAGNPDSAAAMAAVESAYAEYDAVSESMIGAVRQAHASRRMREVSDLPQAS